MEKANFQGDILIILNLLYYYYTNGDGTIKIFNLFISFDPNQLL